MLTEMVADQVAPSYWIPNKDVYVGKILLFIIIIKKHFFLFSRNVPHVICNLVRIIPNIIVEVCIIKIENNI